MLWAALASSVVAAGGEGGVGHALVYVASSEFAGSHSLDSRVVICSRRGLAEICGRSSALLCVYGLSDPVGT
jgi:hypothetical protein